MYLKQKSEMPTTKSWFAIFEADPPGTGCLCYLATTAGWCSKDPFSRMTIHNLFDLFHFCVEQIHRKLFYAPFTNIQTYETTNCTAQTGKTIIAVTFKVTVKLWLFWLHQPCLLRTLLWSFMSQRSIFEHSLLFYDGNFRIIRRDSGTATRSFCGLLGGVTQPIETAVDASELRRASSSLFGGSECNLPTWLQQEMKSRIVR